MKLDEVLECFRNASQLCQVLGITRQNLTHFKKIGYLPIKHQIKLNKMSKGYLKLDEDDPAPQRKKICICPCNCLARRGHRKAEHNKNKTKWRYEDDFSVKLGDAINNRSNNHA